MKKRALIKQPAGIGDIFFCQKIAKKIQDQGYEIIWPVIPEFLWIKDYIDGITFCNIEEEFPHKDIFQYSTNIYTYINNGDIILNLRDADIHIPGESVMIAKYKAVDLDYENWNDHFKFNRNSEKENTLFYDVLKLNDSDKYSLKNYFFASPPREQICELARSAKINTDKEILIRNINGYNVLDWCKVIEQAYEIFTVDTCFTLIVENLKTSNILNIYSRHIPSNFKHVLPILHKKWNFKI